jgi:hypothetical protein
MEPLFCLGMPKQKTNWGDYGDMLRHGMTNHLARSGEYLQLERTGPFLPPVTFPGVSDVVVTDMIKAKLSAVIATLLFRPVLKAHIVQSNWHEWDETTEEPARYPASGEPEDYVLMEPHDPLLADNLGNLWELVPDVVDEIQGNNGSIRMAHYQGQDFVRASLLGGYNFVSARLAKAFEAIAAEDVLLTPAVVSE